MPLWTATVLTLFPEMFPGPLGQSLLGKALEGPEPKWALEVRDIRDFALDRHRSVDDTPFGGGAGMVMRPDVVDRALEALAGKPGPLVYPSPRGPRLDQARVKAWAAGPGIRLLCGRYEGVDQRVLERHAAEEVSLGDFVLAGGELAAMAMLEATVRLLPGVLGNPESRAEESFEGGLLEYPLFTRPAVWRGEAVPEVLTTGNHAEIRRWRRLQAEALTKARRPDLWRDYCAREGRCETEDENNEPDRDP